jgi:hypothetical protein
MNSSNEILDIFYIIVINITLILLCVFLWNYVWIKHYGGKLSKLYSYDPNTSTIFERR